MRRALVAASLLVTTPAAAASPADTLHALVDAEWSWRLRELPQLATATGVHDYDDRLERVDEATQAAHLAHWRGVARELAAVPRAGLATDDRVTAAVLAEDLRSQIGAIEQRTYLMPLNGDSGFYMDLPQIARAGVFATVTDYERYTKRLRDIPRYFDENMALMREGMKRGLTLPRVVLRGRDGAARLHAEVKDPTASAFYEPFRSMPASIAAADAARLQAEGQAAIREAVIPAYAGVARFMAGTYIPAARTTTAASALPGGKAFYREAIRAHLTVDATPDELHATGLREVARIRARMEAIRAEVGFAGELGAFLKLLRTDPQFYARTPDELLARAALIAKRIDARTPAFFGTLPRLPFGIEPVPDAIAPFYTGGRYVPAPPGGHNAGTYWVNTYQLASRPLYVLPSLTLHEAVPGHHLQGALGAEQKGLPPLRRFAYFDVTGEGWALYAERLGEEMGIYTTPYERFGRLTYEMWRACRLVVDTGLHAKGWSRGRALAYLRDNTALSEHEIETETDRYIAWPGQALAYKIGEMAIVALRARAEQALGPRFDVRRFHDAILSLGSVPLPVLEDEIGRFIVEEGKVQSPRP